MRHRGTVLASMGAAVLAASCATVAPVQVHPAAAGEPALARAVGYAYADASEQSDAWLATVRLVESLNGDMPGLVRRWSVHEVRANGQPEVWLVLLDIAPSALGSTPGVFVVEGLLAYGVGAPMPSMTESTVAGDWVGVAEADVGSHHRVAVVWPHGDVLALVMGHSRADTEAFLREFVPTARDGTVAGG